MELLENYHFIAPSWNFMVKNLEAATWLFNIHFCVTTRWRCYKGTALAVLHNV